MNDAGRIYLLFCLAVKRGVLTAEDAVRALDSHSGWVSPSSDSGAATTARPTAEALGEAWRKLPEESRAEFQRALSEAESDAAKAQEIVRSSGMPAEIRSRWWGDSTSPLLQGEAAIDLDFAMGELVAGEEPRMKGVPKLPPEDRYRVRKEVARGGMGRVLLAKDQVLGRRVAVKEMLAGAVGDAATARDVERFLREARVTSQLEHPNIVPVHELGQRADGTLFYTMKLVRGETMAKRLQSIAKETAGGDAGRFRKRMKLLDAFIDVCHAMAYAHSRGVVNRDLKPSNVMLGDFGETVVLDWGLARVNGQEDKMASRVPGVVGSRKYSTINDDLSVSLSKLTMDGAIMGTPSYMSPEQARGEIDLVDEKSDVYTLGAILYEILTGEPPFLKETAAATVQAVTLLEPRPASSLEPRVPPELEGLAAKAMAKDRRNRLESAKVLAEEVIAFRDGRALSTFAYTGWQQATRLTKRHPGLSFGVAAAALALIAGTALSAHWAIRSSQDSRDAKTEGTRAALSAEKAAARAKDAEAAARREEGLKLAARARLLMDTNPGQALWLAVRGAGRAPGSEANSALYAAMIRLSERRRFYGTEDYVDAATFSPDGARIATGGGDHAVRVWDATTGAELKRLDGHVKDVRRVEFNPDGSRLASAADDGRVVLWDPADGREITTARGASGLPGFRWGAGGRLLATWGDGVAPRLWTDAGREAASIGDAEHPATSVAIAPDGKHVAVALKEGVELREIPSGAVVRTMPHEAGATGVGWGAGGRLIVSTDGAGHLRAWDIEGGGPVLDFHAGNGPFSDLIVSPDGTRAAFHADRLVMIVRLSTGEAVASFEHNWPLTAGMLSPDWSRALRGWGNDVVLVDVATGKDLRRFQGHHYFIQSAEFSSDGRRVVSGSCDSTAATWDVEPGRDLHLAPVCPSTGVVDDVDLSRSVAIASYRDHKGLDLLDFRNGAVIRSIYPAMDTDMHGLLLEDGRFLAWRVSPADARILEAVAGKPDVVLPVPGGACGWLSANGPFVVARFDSASASAYRVWDARTAKVVRDFPCALKDYKFGVSRDGTRFVAGNGYGMCATLYDVAAGAPLRAMDGHNGFVLCAGFLGGTSRVLTTAADTSGRIWDSADGRQLSICRWPRIDDLQFAASRSGRFAWLWAYPTARLFDTSTGQLLAHFEEPNGSIDTITWGADDATAIFSEGSGHVRLMPTDPLPVAGQLLPRDLEPFEIAELEIGSAEERQELVREWTVAHRGPRTFNNAGTEHLREKKYAEAAADFRAAIALFPGHTKAHFGLARALAGLGSKEEALREIRAAMELGLSVDYLEHPRAGLESLKGEPGWKDAAATRPPP